MCPYISLILCIRFSLNKKRNFCEKKLYIAWFNKVRGRLQVLLYNFCINPHFLCNFFFTWIHTYTLIYFCCIKYWNKRENMNFSTLEGALDALMYMSTMRSRAYLMGRQYLKGKKKYYSIGMIFNRFTYIRRAGVCAVIRCVFFSIIIHIALNIPTTAALRAAT